MKEEFHIADLIAGHIKGNLTAAENIELENWIADDPANKAIFDEAVDPRQHLEKLKVYQQFDKERARKKLDEELFGKKTVFLNSRKLLRIAAAVMLPVIAAGALYLFSLNQGSENLIAEIDQSIHPGSSRATLIMSDGEEIMLDSLITFSPINISNVSIEQEGNRVLYNLTDRAGDTQGKIEYNELRTPRGGSFEIQLADGSSVWLNAGSSLRFPVNFSSDRREVILEGEGYFRVAHSETPFLVSTHQSEIMVLGTTFNVSAYRDDQQVVTTLDEGRVEVSVPGTDIQPMILNPNEQAVVKSSSSEISKNEVDATGFTSWRTGKFEFHNESLAEVMKKLSRWYDFDYTFNNESARDFHFSARIDRFAEISTLLDMLELTTRVEFAYENGIIVVK